MVQWKNVVVQWKNVVERLQIPSLWSFCSSSLISTQISVILIRFCFFFFPRCFHRHQQRQLPPEVGQLWGSREPHLPWDTRAQPQAPGGAEGEALQSYSALRRRGVEPSHWGLESAGVARYKQTGCMYMVQPELSNNEAIIREHPGFASLFWRSPSSNTPALVGILTSLFDQRIICI